MKRTCKQCGKEFELSQAEINFYNSKNLQLPKRCEACRQQNKVKTPVNNVPHISESGKKTDKKRIASIIITAIIIVAFLLIFPEFTQNAEQYTDNSVAEQEYAGTQYKFKNKELLDQHYEKHGIEMGFTSAEEYETAASAVVNNPNALHKTEKEDGDDVYYVEATNEFVIVSMQGYIRTYFNPDAGISYYNRQ